MAIEVQGLDRLDAALEKIVDINKMSNVMQKACLMVERSAKQKAPKGRTGELARSITSKVENEGDNLAGIVYTPLEYAPYVEYGTGLFAENGGRDDVPWHYQDEQGEWHTTSGQQPQPYLRPALQENREEILRILREGLKT